MNRIAALLNSQPADRDWAVAKWHAWNDRNRFDVRPVRRAHAVGNWPLDKRDHYTLLFPDDEFSSLFDFLAYDFFHASVLQTVARDTPPEGRWFRLIELEEYVSTLLGFIRSITDVLDQSEVNRWLRSWELPPECEWFRSLEFCQGVVREEEGSDATLWARTSNGYAVFLCVKG